MRCVWLNAAPATSAPEVAASLVGKEGCRGLLLAFNFLRAVCVQ